VTITKSERTELRSVVRQQRKVLRSEIRQREAEILAEIDATIAEKYAEADARAEVVYREMDRIVRGANREIGDLVAEASNERWRFHEFLHVPRLSRTDDRPRSALRQAAVSDLKSKVQSAALQLDRQEADLLRQLSVEALETEDARRFLSSIPCVSDLVPAVRLAELEAALEGGPERPFDPPRPF
jgi:hypothetical protein